MYDNFLKQVIIKRTDLFRCLSVFDYSDNMLVSAGSVWCHIQVNDDKELDVLKRAGINYREIEL